MDLLNIKCSCIVLVTVRTHFIIMIHSPNACLMAEVWRMELNWTRTLIIVYKSKILNFSLIVTVFDFTNVILWWFASVA
jgi:hypothetical protein